ncbi:transcriptional regulator [Streptomyces pinistramenti]|uniref:transcriptional regulator n=1 Tax=Streptomyces pinistramenti TaxID=2884812 RepID=UPI001D08D233|nr:transcriptional regulator [Streptomyces pinistramenti]MCB5910357.1 transcriptional regulator [Streptomyces pinistramenti]
MPEASRSSGPGARRSSIPGYVPNGQLGATGTPLGQAIGTFLDEAAAGRVRGIKSPITTRRGLNARLNALAKTGPAREAAAEHGIKPRDVNDWSKGRRRPRPASLERIEQAYQATLARKGGARRAVRREFDRGRGATIQVTPLDQSRVQEKHRRVLGPGEVRISEYRWGPLLNAWEEGDYGAVEDLAFAAMEEGGEYLVYAWVGSAAIA